MLAGDHAMLEAEILHHFKTDANFSLSIVESQVKHDCAKFREFVFKAGT